MEGQGKRSGQRQKGDLHFPKYGFKETKMTLFEVNLQRLGFGRALIIQ
jgi:ribosomal protein L15